ncbi:hypothetical protein BLJ79_08790 [Arthrobacter sp. UCD-GKA]|uniref:LLM class flavin-dependent oxidoreductase n=1 Tax=Arthrobacter sp. UCD-GKA TaxID=1913576 RepID=UPI0008DDADC0|nr:LLM class flavin-dependent oxidoreductase [Arthrobacter sp. UCD-GKA]OIH85261.1 hypothetical protein BLJ79_08790 [Arthrobacter sp. UCD-GKA]
MDATTRKYAAFILIGNSPDPFTGHQLSTIQRSKAAVPGAARAEEYGFDAYGIGERHAQRFLTSPLRCWRPSPQASPRLRLLTTVTVLSLRHPVYVFWAWA